MTKKPNTSVITSFDIDHFGLVENAWPEGLFQAVEVYGFMHNCLEKLFEGNRYLETGNALRVLAEARNLPDEAERVAGIIDKHFAKSQICAISSFLPEISSSDKSDNWKYAQEALEFLVLTVSALNKQYSHPCQVLEIVAGSRVNGMYRSEDIAGDQVSVVNLLPEDKSINRLLTRLTPIATLAANAGVKLAVELEPGPLFTIGDWNSLLRFCNALDQDNGALNSAVGVNLDIAHWDFLAGISPRLVRSNPSILKRIVHAHVSDHSRGHCSDAIPTMFHSAAAFLPWFQLLVDIMNLPGPSTENILKFSGYISCELESAYDIETVGLASKVIQHWIDYCC